MTKHIPPPKLPLELKTVRKITPTTELELSKAQKTTDNELFHLPTCDILGELHGADIAFKTKAYIDSTTLYVNDNHIFTHRELKACSDFYVFIGVTLVAHGHPRLWVKK